jgi:hypothetical protein
MAFIFYFLKLIRQLATDRQTDRQTDKHYINNGYYYILDVAYSKKSVHAVLYRGRLKAGKRDKTLGSFMIQLQHSCEQFATKILFGKCQSC